jgi:hypothetical protein
MTAAPRPTRRRGQLALVALLFVAACQGSPPASPGASLAPSGSGSAYASDELLQSLSDPSWERLATVGEDLDAAVDTDTGLVEAIGEESVAWLTDERTAAVTAALEAAGISLPDLGPARLTDEPVAAAGPMTAFGGQAYVGTVLTGALGLDALLEHIGESGEYNGEPLESQSEQTHGDLHTVQSTTVTFHTSVSGSTVISEADATQQSTTTNTQTGAVITTNAYRSHVRAMLDACPDTDGITTLTMEVEQSSQTGGSLGSSSWEAHWSSETEGQVGEDAWLQSETEVGEMEVTETSSDGATRNGAVSTTLTTSRQPTGGGFGGVSARGTDSGTMNGGDRLRWYTFMKMTSAIVSSRGFDKAQEQWRSGKCVRIEATESSRQVDKQEVVTFTAEPWHRIDGDRLNKRIVATLAGVASVEPEGAAQDPPATVVYRAGTEEGDQGTVTLTSTSNRGIGTLEITFTVRVAYRIDGTRSNNQGATGTVHGEKCDGIDGEWILDGTYTAGGFYNGTQQWVITVDEQTMTGTFTYTDLQVGMVPGVPRTEGQAAGTVTVSEDEEGDVHMHLVETSHSFRTETTAPAGGWGRDQNAPLEEYDYVWEQDDAC